MAKVLKLPNVIKKETIKTEPNTSSFEKLPDIKHASPVSINNNNGNNPYSHGNGTIGLQDFNFPNEQSNKVSITDNSDTSVVPGTMDPQHSASARHGLLPKHQQDSGISLTSSDLNQQESNMDDKEYLQENYDEWFLPDQYADYKAEKMKSLTKSLIEMTTKDTESLKSSNSFVIDASDTTPEEDDYLQSAQKELGSKETRKKKEAKKEEEPSKNLEDVEDRVARLMEYLNKHVPDEDVESITTQDVDTVVEKESNGTNSNITESTQSTSSQEISNHREVKIQSKQTLLLQINKQIPSSSKVQSSVKSDTKHSTQNPSTGLVSTHKSPTVKKRPVRTHLPKVTHNRSVQQRQIKTENTEQKKQSVKQKVNERNYFKPISAPAIPPVRHAKSHLPKKFTGSNTSKPPPTKPKRYSPKLSRRYKRPVAREPPTTIRYPSRSERERQLRDAEELMSIRSTSSYLSQSTDDQRTVSDDAFSQRGEQNDIISDEHSITKSLSNTSAIPTTSEDTNQSVETNASVAPSASEGPHNSDNPIGANSHTAEYHSQPVNPSESEKLSLIEPDISKDPGQSETTSSSQSTAPSSDQSKASQEELKSMETMLKISEKCFVRKSKPNVT